MKITIHIKMLVMMLLMPCLMQGESFDQQVIEKYTQENLSLLQWRAYKQMGYGALIAATVYGAGFAVLNSTSNFNYLAEKLRELPSKAHVDSQQTSGFFNTATSFVSSLSWSVSVALTSAGIVALSKSIASENGVLKNTYTDIIAAFTTPHVTWYMQHYVPVYDRLESFKYCAVYFDMNSPFLQNVHNNAITMQYIQSLVKAGQEGNYSGYAQFLQKKAEVAVGNAQELLQYDECLAAYRYRKNNGQVIEEDTSLLNKMRELHVNIVEDLEKIMGFVYAQLRYNKYTMTESETEFFTGVIKKMREYSDHISSLLHGTEAERQQASLQGIGLFTSAHEFELYLKTIFRS